MKNKGTIYLVIRQGMYRHDIKGVYEDFDLAKSKAKEAAIEEEDSWNGMNIYKTTINKPIEAILIGQYNKMESGIKWRLR